MKAPKINPDLAEVTGLLLGDGCLSHYYTSNGVERFEIAFTGYFREKEYYEKFVKKVFQKYFQVNGYLRLRNDNSVRYHVKHIDSFKFFKELGVKVGEKKIVRLPGIIKSNPNLWVPFVRGIFDAEGSIYRRYSKKYKGHTKTYNNLLVAQIKMNCSLSFMSFIKSVLNKYHIKSNKITQIGPTQILRITHQKEILKFLKIFNPKVKNAPLDTRRYTL